MMFKKTSSYLSNIIVKTSHLMKNLTTKMKLNYPMMLNDLFKKYATLDYFPADGGLNSPPSSSYSPSKKGSRLNLDGGYSDQGSSRLNVGGSPSKALRSPKG